MLYNPQIYVAFLIPLMVTILIVPKLSIFASRIGLLDYPNKRKVHNIPKPLIGGLAMSIALFISCMLFIPTTNLIGFYAGVITLVIMGFLDDFRELGHRWKFMVQILASIFMIYLGNTVVRSFGDFLSFGPFNLGSFAIPITVVCTVGVINAVNMIDGLDGLAGGVSLIGFVSFGILAYINNQVELMLLSIALSGAVIGFLIYNWHPSKLFMGDLGSFTLGFSLVFLSISITQKNNSIVSPAAALLILAVPIVDTVTIAIKRVITRKNPFTADKNHIHHMLLRYGLSKKNTVKTILLLSVIFSFFSVFGTIYKIPDYYLFLMFLVFFITYFVFFVSSVYIRKIYKYKYGKKKEWEYGKLGTLAMKISYAVGNEQEKRNDPRYPLSLHFSGFSENNNQKCGGALINIGFGGFSTKLETVLAKGDIMNINLLLSENGNQNNLCTNAKVVWMHKDNGGYKYGLKFIKMRKGRRSILRDYLYSVV